MRVISVLFRLESRLHSIEFGKFGAEQSIESTFQLDRREARSGE